MRVKRSTPTVDYSIDRKIAALAGGQRGYVNREQLLRVGLGREAINRRVKIGRLIPVYTGVYAVGHVPTLPVDRAYAALLACGEKAVLSHGSATTLYGIYRMWDLPFEVTVPTAKRRTGICIHRARLTRADITLKEGLPVTSPARTLFDMAARLTDKQRRRAFDRLRLDHGLRPEQLRSFAGRATCLQPLAGTRRGATRSELERKFDAFSKRHGLPEPLLNVKINGREVDAFFPVERVIVEIDGYDVHSGRVSFEDDRDRDASMLVLGLPTVRVTEERIDNAPEREAARLHEILDQRRG